MSTKDWLLLMIPILSNGVVLFILQKLFEKKQLQSNIKREYFSIMRQRIDASLALHATATRLANESNVQNGDIINSTVTQFFNSCLDVYYYYVENKVILSSTKKEFEDLSDSLMFLSREVNTKIITPIQICNNINMIRDSLQKIKTICMK